MAKRKSIFADTADAGIRFIGTPEDDTIIGSAGDDYIEGRPGMDSIEGLGGNDTIFGGANDDQIYGGDGNDLLDGGGRWDTLDGGLGADTMRGGADQDLYIVDDAGDVIIDSGGGGEVHSSVSYTLSAGLGGLWLRGEEDLNGTGNEEGNGLRGNVGNNVLTGLGGDDHLSTDGGNDTLIGGTGDDGYEFWGEDVNVTVIENAGEGTDRVVIYGWEHDSFTLYDNVENVHIQFFTDQAVTVHLNNESNTTSFYINDTDMTLYAYDGDDNVEFLRGDLVDLGAGNDTLRSEADGAELYGGAGNDDFTVSGEGVTVFGGSGNDSMFSYNAVTFVGGAGRDTVQVGDLWAENIVTFVDFNGNQDKLLISDYEKPELSNFRAANFRANGSGTAQDANDYIVYNTSTGALYYDVDGNGADAAVQIATINVTNGSFDHRDIEIAHFS